MYNIGWRVQLCFVFLLPHERMDASMIHPDGNLRLFRLLGIRVRTTRNGGTPARPSLREQVPCAPGSTE
jgi:hypothetical protein